MKTYYVAGLPYSDDLWHSGTKGMKWGQRLYQNPDGTLTPLGKIHYKALKAAKSVGSSASKATRAVVQNEINKFKRRHPWTMSDQELDNDLKRLQKEKQVKDAYYAVRGKSVGRKLLEKTGDISYSSAKKFGEKFGEKMGEKIVDPIIKNATTSKRAKKTEKLTEETLWYNRKIENAKAREAWKKKKEEIKGDKKKED